MSDPKVQTVRGKPVRTPGEAADLKPQKGIDESGIGDEEDLDDLQAGADDLEMPPAPVNPEAAPADQVVAMTPAQLQAIIDKAVAQALTAQRTAQSGSAEAPLPDEKDIDPRKIAREVLTKQGYVVPIKGPDPRDPDALYRRA